VRTLPGPQTPPLAGQPERATTAEPVSFAKDRQYLLVFENDRSFMFALPRDGEVSIGRAEDAGLAIADASVSRQHARVLMKAGEATLADLGSQNGTHLNGERVVGARALASGDAVLLGNITLIFHSSARAQSSRGIVPLDDFRQRCEEELERSLRYHRPLSLACLALAGASDRVLIARALEGQLRLLDVLSWSGNDQLFVLMPETGPDTAPAAARRLLQVLERVAPAAHAGLASSPVDGCDFATLLASARAAAGGPGAEKVSAAARAYEEIVLGERIAIVADPAMSRLYHLVRRLATSELPVLVGGETGTGKELAASAVHHFSPRRTGPLVAVNCAAIAESLLEGELFGWERGAFSGATSARAGLLEAAEGGTIFLDEIGELSATAQAKLLRVLEAKRVMRLGDTRERVIDIRIVAATNRDLEDEVAGGRFRQDLFFRLSGARLWIPPLRDRPRELPILAQRFLTDACRRLQKPVPAIADEAMRRLVAYAWPGNVRELRNLMEYVAATVEIDTVIAEHLPAPIASVGRRQPLPAGSAATRAPESVTSASPANFRPIDEEIRELEKSRMAAALAATGGNQKRAAELISMPRRTFVTKLKEYGLGRGDEREPS